MIGVRKALDCVFTQRELKILDDVMPEHIQRTEEYSANANGNTDVSMNEQTCQNGKFEFRIRITDASIRVKSNFDDFLFICIFYN